jgi:hypothetical protein
MEKMTLRFVYVASLLAVVGALAVAPAAFAADSSVQGYTNAEGQVVGGGGGGGPNNSAGGPGDTTTTKATEGSGNGNGILPFTGLDLGFLIGGGALLIAVGAGLARFGPQGDTT